MEKHEADLDIQNIYALTVKDEEIFIGDAVSGKKGYFCLGCKREMQAVKSQIIGRQSYFRHDVEANKNHGKCTYSDETHRHKIAKDQLQLTKRLKVPPIYKLQGDGTGLAMFVSPSKFIEAHRVANELQFYEDDDGIIRWGRDISVGKNLLIRPDVTFFDAEDQPILLIEIVATHKLTAEKLTKILRLGIDTVSVTIPKDSPENIEDTFNQITRTEWIYSNEQQSANYIPSADGHSEDVPLISEEQRRNFKLTLKCRQAEVRSLISRIRRCLESEQFREINERNQRELSRVKGNTDKLLRDIEREEGSYRQSVEEQEKIEIRDNSNTRRANQLVIEKHSGRYRDLEARYIRKAEEISREQETIDGEFKLSLEGYGRFGKDHEERRTRSKYEASSLEGVINLETKNIKELSSLTEDFTKQYEYFKEAEEQTIARDTEYREELSEKYRDIEGKVATEFARRGQEINEAFNSGEIETTPELSERIRRVDIAWRQLHALIENQRIIKRNRAIREFVISGVFKAWL